MGGLCLAAFVLVIYAFGRGKTSLGRGCNETYNATCDTVFRARAATFSLLSFLILVTAWEVKHFSRSLFALDPQRFRGVKGVWASLRDNRFLFWAVVGGFVVTWPVVYVPVVDRKVFRHAGIGWEWGVVAGGVAVYLVGVEAWKAVKRRFGLGGARYSKGGSKEDV
jgi:Na+-exporting ATPase